MAEAPAHNLENRKSPPRDDARGSALLVTLTILSLLSSIAAFAVLQARSDSLIQQNARAALTAFTVAEAGLELARADLERDARFSRMAAAAGGPYPFAAPPPEFFPAPPFRFQVTVAARDTEHVDIISLSSGGSGQHARLVLSVRREPAPFVPAALDSAAAPPSLLLGGDFRIAGGRGVPGLGVRGAEAARLLLSAIDADTAARIDGEPPVAGSVSGVFTSLFDRIATNSTAQTLPPRVDGGLGHGVFFSAQSLTAVAVEGSGILLVDGDFNVEQSFAFDGLVLVRGDLMFGEDSIVQIDGGVLQGAPGAALHLRGRGAIRHDAAQLTAAEGLLDAPLDRRAVMAGWRDDT